MRPRGMSLLETVVAMAVAALFGTALLQLFTTGMRLYVRSQTRASLQTQAALAVTRLSDEATRSAMATLTAVPKCRTGGPALSYRPVPAERTGRSEFTPAQWFTVTWLDPSTRSLMSKRWPAAQGEPVALSPDPVMTCRRLTATEIDQVIARKNGTERKVAGDIASLAFTPATYPDGAKTTGLRLQIVLQKDGVQQTLVSAITPRNRP